MQFWPFALAILGSVSVAAAVIALMMRLQKPDVRSLSPHHRWNTRTDLILAKDSEAAK